LPTVDGLELAVVSLPAAREELIGGDFHDVFRLPEGSVIALVGDVMGKGIKAAGFTETVRSAVRTLAFISPTPDYILANVNRLLLHQGQHQQLVTAVVVAFDPATGQGSVASAGHPPIVHLSGLACQFIEPHHGLPLGALEQSYAATSFDVAPGEALVLYTDGLTEARRNGELFGERRLLDALRHVSDRRPQALVDHLREVVLAYSGALRDDLEILALQRTEQSE
jgi:sigma-B regulation protein RsbU (phosphoserine phosphatase)